MDVSNSVSKRLSINELRRDMILAQDVVNDWGAVLLPKETVLNNTNFDKLFSNSIRYIYVKEDSIDYNSPEFVEKKPTTKNEIIDERNKPIKEQKAFVHFERDYELKTVELKNTLLAIGDGDIIDVEKLSGLTDGIMNNLRSKSDVFSYLNFIKSSDEHTFSHSNNVALLCNLFGTWLNFSKEQLMLLTAAGLLHDIGKTKVDNEILNKSTKLTDAEFNHIKQHPLLGYRILETRNIDKEIKLAALMHHEKIDGTGYPLKAKGDQINDFSKIVAICDIYDAMTANRVYRNKICPFNVIKTFEQRSYGALDTKYLLVFLENIAYTYIGSNVLLSDDKKAEIVFINNHDLSRPIVKTESGEIIDLSTNKTKEILQIV